MKISKILVTLVALMFSTMSFAGSTATVIDDTSITAKVKAKLLAEKSVSALKIHVETREGVVVLSGNVHTDNEVSTAVELAAETDGVRDVDISRLAVDNSVHPLDDSVITAKVKGLYLREKLFGDKPVAVATVHVETKDGVVYLTGNVDSEAKAKAAKDLAKSVKGVKDVKSSIEIKKA